MDKDKNNANRKVDDLRPHPSQSELFKKDLNDFELTQLAGDMQREGLWQPIQISAAGEIINGHARVLFARKLGWKEIDFIVRDD